MNNAVIALRRRRLFGTEHTRKRLTSNYSIATLGVMTVADAIEAALNL